MRFLTEIRERRLVPLMGAYIVTGFVALEAIDQLVSYEFVAEVAYPITLVLYMFGIPSSLIFAWFHGAPGRQYGPKAEVIAQSTLAVIAIAVSVVVYKDQTAGAGLAAGSGLSATRIAVLYFEDLSDGELAPVADGVTEALIDRLGEVRSLDVISRNGVLPYRNLGLRPDSVARALGAGTVIEGSVEQRGDQIRITTRLVDGLSGAAIERALSEIPAGDFLSARDSVTESVSRLLRERLGEEIQLREFQSGTSSADAWALVQRAERLRTDAEDAFEAGGDITASLETFRQVDTLLAAAEAIDPAWVQPKAARAHAAYRRAWFSAGQGDIEAATLGIEVGVEHANRALAIDPDNAPALEHRGTLNLFRAAATGPAPEEMQRLMSVARTDLEAAVRQDPSLATAHAMLSFMFAGMADNVSAVLSARRALEEDAYLRGADRIYDRLFYAQYELEQFRDASQWCDEGNRRFGDNYRFAECRLWLMATPSGEPDVDAAWQWLARLDSLSPESLRPFKHGVGRIMVAGVLRKASLPDSASNVLAAVNHSEEVDPQRQLFVYEAAIRASTGDPDGALEALRRWAAATPGSTLGPGAELHWWWRELRSRPEFQAFVRR